MATPNRYIQFKSHLVYCKGNYTRKSWRNEWEQHWKENAPILGNQRIKALKDHLIKVLFHPFYINWCTCCIFDFSWWLVGPIYTHIYVAEIVDIIGRTSWRHHVRHYWWIFRIKIKYAVSLNVIDLYSPQLYFNKEIYKKNESQVSMNEYYRIRSS